MFLSASSPRFDRVYESYAAKCGGNGVSLRAMEDAAKQFVGSSRETGDGWVNHKSVWIEPTKKDHRYPKMMLVDQ